MKISTKKFSTHIKRALKAAQLGEEIIITHNDKPYAKLVPIGKRQSKSRLSVGKKSIKLLLFGIWKDYNEIRNVAAYVDRLRNRHYR